MSPVSGLVIVDKPAGWTSHDVVARMRRLAGTRRVGHAGTLDPMATGVLVVGVEKATRLLGHLALTAKVYDGVIRLGESTSTDDAEGEPAGAVPAGHLADAEIADAVKALTGEIMQVPPQVSAIKVNGQRAYKMARKGEEVELAARPVTVHEFRVLDVRRHGEVIDVDASQVEPRPTFGAGIRTDFIDSILNIGQRFTVVLDVGRVLSADEIAGLMGVAHEDDAIAD